MKKNLVALAMCFFMGSSLLAMKPEVVAVINGRIQGCYERLHEILCYRYDDSLRYDLTQRLEECGQMVGVVSDESDPNYAILLRKLACIEDDLLEAGAFVQVELDVEKRQEAEEESYFVPDEFDKYYEAVERKNRQRLKKRDYLRYQKRLPGY